MGPTRTVLRKCKLKFEERQHSSIIHAVIVECFTSDTVAATHFFEMKWFPLVVMNTTE